MINGSEQKKIGGRAKKRKSQTENELMVSQTRKGKKPKAARAIETSFMEDDDVVHLRVDGADRDLFKSNEDTGSESDSDGDIDQEQNNCVNEQAITLSDKRKNRSQEAESSEDLSDGEITETDLTEQNEQLQTTKHLATSLDEVEDSVKQQLIGETIAKMMKQLMEDGRLLMDKETTKEKIKFNKQPKGKNLVEVMGSTSPVSELTIYENAVRDGTTVKRQSSSSEEAETSDDSIDKQLDLIRKSFNDLQLIFADVPDKTAWRIDKSQREKDDHQPSMSGYRGRVHEGRTQLNEERNDMTPEDRAARMVRQADSARAKIFNVSGKTDFPHENSGLIHSVLVDERYLSVASHIDVGLKNKIVKGEYINFARLLPMDKVTKQGEQRLQMVNRDGYTCFMPFESDLSGINSCARWDQAFRVFSDIYTRASPGKAMELIQYSHIIHTASQTYVWDNVYAYDKDFRMHIAENPGRSWAIILQQAWSLRLKDRIGARDFHKHNNYEGGYLSGGHKEI